MLVASEWAKSPNWKTSCPASCLPLHSWNRRLRPGETPRGIQLQVPVLSEALGEAGAADRGHPQDWADVSWHPAVSLCASVPLGFLRPGRTGARATHPLLVHVWLWGSVTQQSNHTSLHDARLNDKVMDVARGLVRSSDPGERYRQELAPGKAS